jgi:hypothetical protein
MTDEHAATEDAERAAIRDRYRALRAQLAVLTDDDYRPLGLILHPTADRDPA